MTATPHRGGARVVAAALLVCAALLVSSCGKSATDTYYDMVAAAKLGDRETFLKGFTEDSRHLIEALLELSDVYGLKRRHPYSLLVYTDVVAEDRGEPDKKPGMEEAREVAILTVQMRSRRRKIKMVQVDGAWQIDAFDLENFWETRANFRF